jgi:copper chaperone CopZ
MEKLVLDLPSMYGDHHVLAVRDVLTGIEGIDELYASAAWKQAMVSYDPKKVKPDAIEKALADAGYPVGEGAPEILVSASDIKRDPQWEVLEVRVCETNSADLEMSGEFRRY